MADVILVLGMHRSGTSAVAGTLTKLGASAPKNLMPADRYNTRGHFKSTKLADFHDELLTSAGSTWTDWRAFNSSWPSSPLAAPFKQRAHELYESEFDGSPFSVMKDPRICRFAPFWLDVLREGRHAVRIVMPVRSPLDVASSLKRRDGLPLTKGLLLWLRYCLDAEVSTRGEARSILLWHEFLSDWRQACNKIAADTGLSWPRLSDRSAHEIDAFLSREMVHHETDHPSLLAHPDAHVWAVRTYEALIELSRNPMSNSALATLDQIRGHLDDASEIFGRLLINSEIQLETLQAHAHALNNEQDVLRARQSEIAAERDAARADLSARAAEFERMLDEGRAEKAGLSDALAALRVEHDTLAGERARQEAEFDARQSEIAAERDAARADLSARAAEFERMLDEARAEKAGLSEALAALRVEHNTLAGERAAARGRV